VRLLIQGVGCLAVGIFVVIGILGAIVVFDPLVAGTTRVGWGVAAVIALGAGWIVWDHRLRSAAAENARRTETPGTRMGTKVRTYRGYAYDIAVDWFQRDAKLLASNGYRVVDTQWAWLENEHPIRYALLSIIGLMTRGTNWGQEGGALRVTYELGATPDQALTSLAFCVRRLRDGP
jgi:hypothetical protein